MAAPVKLACPTLKGAYVTRESEALQSGLPGGLGTGRETINRAIGCRNLVQRVLRYLPGTRGESLNPAEEEVLFVLQGRGEAVIGGVECALRPDMGVLVPPGVRCRIASHGPGELVLLSAVSPQPGEPPGTAGRSQPPRGRQAVGVGGRGGGYSRRGRSAASSS